MSPEEELEDLISHAAEEAFGLAWMPGIEFEVWHRMSDAPEALLGAAPIARALLGRLRELVAGLGGWMLFTWTRGQVIVPLDEWRWLQARWALGASPVELLEPYVRRPASVSSKVAPGTQP
jgi:hypothetical protein